jgi:hypothetical protein
MPTPTVFHRFVRAPSSDLVGGECMPQLTIRFCEPEHAAESSSSSSQARYEHTITEAISGNNERAMGNYKP